MKNFLRIFFLIVLFSIVYPKANSQYIPGLFLCSCRIPLNESTGCPYFIYSWVQPATGACCPNYAIPNTFQKSNVIGCNGEGLGPAPSFIDNAYITKYCPNCNAGGGPL